MMSIQNFQLKYVVVGDTGVGKSCLVEQFTRKTFQEAHLTTIGVNLAEVTRSFCINGCEVKIQVWDTAGMEVYRSLTTAYYRNTAVTLLVYDVTRRNTFHSLNDWLRDIKEACNNKHMMILVVGNKIDLVKERQVSRQEGQEFATHNKLFFMETSSKVLETVEKVFFLTARVYYEKIDMGDIDIVHRPELYGVKLQDESDNDIVISDTNGSSQGCSC